MVLISARGGQLKRRRASSLSMGSANWRQNANDDDDDQQVKRQKTRMPAAGAAAAAGATAAVATTITEHFGNNETKVRRRRTKVERRSKDSKNRLKSVWKQAKRKNAGTAARVEWSLKQGQGRRTGRGAGAGKGTGTRTGRGMATGVGTGTGLDGIRKSVNRDSVNGSQSLLCTHTHTHINIDRGTLQTWLSAANHVLCSSLFYVSVEYHVT